MTSLAEYLAFPVYVTAVENLIIQSDLVIPPRIVVLQYLAGD